MSQTIEIMLDKETLTKIIKEELVQDENAQNCTDYEIEFLGTEPANFYVRVSKETVVEGQKGRLIENIRGQVVELILKSKFSSELGNVNYMYPIFEGGLGNQKFVNIRLVISAKDYNKTFLKKSYPNPR